MRTHWTGLLGRLAAVAGIVAVLGFGTREAVAADRTNAAQVCENYPNCSSQKECRDCCIVLGYEEGFCTPTGACLCS